jgi:exosortase
VSEKPGDTRSALLALTPAWLALAWLVSKAQWFWTHRPDMQFGWIVLMLSAFIVWDRWSQRPPAVFRARWPLFVIAPIGFGLLFLIQIYQAAYGMMAALLMGLSFGAFAIVAANAHYVFGWPGVRFFAFPVLFLLIALPLPSVLYDPIVVGLQNKVATVNVEVLNLIGIPARRAGSLIHLPNGTVGVDEACSGIRSLQSTVMATLFIGFLSLKRRSLQVLLLACGIALAIIGNLARSLILSLTANAKGLEAVKDAHDSAGWSILAFTAGGVILVAWGFSKYEKWLARATIRLRARQGAEPVEA